MGESGKLQQAVDIAASSPAPNEINCRKYRLFVKDRNTGLRYLVDSGADVSIFPARANDVVDDTYKLYAANGTEIATYGLKICNLDLGLRRQFEWPFVVAKTNKPIIGADFLNKFKLLVDISNRRLIDGETQLCVKGDVTTISNEKDISTMSKDAKFSHLLTQYPEITKPNLTPSNIKHDVKHYITTDGTPVFSRARPLDPKRLKIAKQEFQFMLDNGIIRPSKSQWASPLHMASKKDGNIRPCGDYRRLNERTLPDRYPVPRIEDFHYILKNKKVFSKIDLFKAYFQIPIAEEDKPKTAIITPFGLYEFNVMSFGLRNAPSTFQRFINEVCHGLDFVFPYLDDILIASASNEEHEGHLKMLMKRLAEYGLRINMSKSVFGVQELGFLGYWITPEGSKPLPEKVQAILDYKLPEKIHELRTFLGIVNFYRPYLKDAAQTQSVLHDYLRGARKRDKRPIQWTDEAKAMFEKCKQDVANIALLTFPDPELPLALYTDASDTSVGSVLQQCENGNWKPIAFFSKKLNETQKAYSTYDRELLAIYQSIKKFKHLLEGRNFMVLTDHKPLTFAFKQKNEKASPRQLRQLQYISQFTTNIHHISGKDNVVADGMSRIEEIAEINYEIIAKDQAGDKELQQLLMESKSLKFKQCTLPTGKILWCDTSTTQIRPFIPKLHRYKLFQQMHNLAHLGVKSTVKLMTCKFVWPDIRRDVQQWTRSCVSCQRNKVTRHTKTPLGKYEEPDERFSVIHIDIIGPLPPSNGMLYCLTCIDRFTSWMEVVPLPNITAETIAKAFYEHWITRFGTPSRVISDQGAQFKSELFKSLTRMCGVEMQHTTPYHPQCNGKVERLHRTLKAALRAHNSIHWTDTLPTVLLGLRGALQETTNSSIAQMVYGKTIRLPGEFFEEQPIRSDPESFASKLQEKMLLIKPFPPRHPKTLPVFIPKDLMSCSHVFVRLDRIKRSLEPSYDGPYPVVRRHDKYFAINIKSKVVNISMDRLKPAYLLSTEAEPELQQKEDRHAGNIPQEKPVLYNPNSKIKTTKSGRRVTFPKRFMD